MIDKNNLKSPSVSGTLLIRVTPDQVFQKLKPWYCCGSIKPRGSRLWNISRGQNHFSNWRSTEEENKRIDLYIPNVNPLLTLLYCSDEKLWSMLYCCLRDMYLHFQLYLYLFLNICICIIHGDEKPWGMLYCCWRDDKEELWWCYCSKERAKTYLDSPGIPCHTTQKELFE